MFWGVGVIGITGASGYIGSALVARLESQCAPGNGLVFLGRRSAQGAGEFRFLDLASDADLCAPLRGITTLIHCAGLAHNQGDPDDYQRINVDATVALAQAAGEAGVKRFLFLSSLNLVSAEAEDPELPAAKLPEPHTAYARSKWRAEQALEASLQGTNIELVLLRPALVYDRELTANLSVLARLAHRLWVQLPRVGRRSMVSRGDLVGWMGDWATKLPASPESVARVAATDGCHYTAADIAAALDARQRISLPLPLWRVLCRLRDLASGASPGTTWASLAGTYWTGPASKTAGWQPQQTLGSVFGASGGPT